MANAINTSTAMRLNEYIYGCLMNENKKNAEHRRMIRREPRT